MPFERPSFLTETLAHKIRAYEKQDDICLIEMPIEFC
jgi:hypothetical protein